MENDVMERQLYILVAWFPKTYGRNKNIRPCWSMAHDPPLYDSFTLNVFVCNARWQRSQRTACPLVVVKASITSLPSRWECDATSRLPSMRLFLQLRGLVAVALGALRLVGPVCWREKSVVLLLRAARWIYCHIC